MTEWIFTQWEVTSWTHFLGQVILPLINFVTIILLCINFPKLWHRG